MGPHGLKATLLEDASTDQKQQFAEMLAEQCAVADKQAKEGLAWFFVPSPTEYERMKRFNQPPNYDQCPQCGKGRVKVEIYNGNLGQSWNIVCMKKCGFKEYVSDDE